MGRLSCFLDAAADGDDDGSGAEIDGLRGFAEGRFRFVADGHCVELGGEGFDGGRAGFERFGTEGAGLHGEESRAGAGVAIVRVELALKELADEDEAVAILAQADEIGQQHLAEAGGKAGREVAHLIGVGEDDEARIELADELLECGYVTVSSVILEQCVLDAVALVEFFVGELTA